MIELILLPKFSCFLDAYKRHQFARYWHDLVSCSIRHTLNDI